MGLKTSPIEGIDYQLGFFANVQGTNAMVELLTGPFKGTVYSYDWVKVTEEPSLGIAKLSFHFTIIHGVKYQNDSAFHHHAGDVLRSIMISKEPRIGKLNELNNGSKSTKADSTILHT
jgi:hypothetical protein